MAKRIFWFVFFFFCMLLGYLHGSNPDISKSAIIAPKRIGIFSTHEQFFPKEVRTELEKKFNVIFVFKVETDWDILIADVVSKETADLIFAPSYWLNSLTKQNLLFDIHGSAPELLNQVSSDFINKNPESNGLFIPLFWMKTGFHKPSDADFKTLLGNKENTDLFLLNEEDLLAAHIINWQNSNITSLVKSKQILLEDTAGISSLENSGFRETKISQNQNNEDPLLKSALLMYGLSMNENAPNKKLLLELIKEYSKPEIQIKIMQKTRFNTCLSNLEDDSSLEASKKASYIRQLRLSNTVILDQKNIAAKKIVNDFLNQ